MMEISKYKSETRPDWCPGCGDFGVLNALVQAVTNLNIDPKDLLVVSGIGCSSNLPGFINAYGFHSLHGRSIPIATGAKLANPELNVVVTGGDGDGYGIGLGHFIHAMRRNLNLTYVVMDNQIYGLTTGQASPTSQKNFVTKSSPSGTIEEPINPIALALISGASYVARGFSGDPKHLTELIQNGIAHNGFSLIDVFSPCVTWNRINTYEYFRQKCVKFNGPGYDASNFEQAVAKSREREPKLPIGLFYETQKPTYEEQDPALKAGNPVKAVLGVSDPKQLLQEFY
ncbi:MAG: 2-oxoacid:ferredoxin oxidoreductase subunit beta [Nitrososphaerota archaeon]|nr:2-oxoacid:ferredoxin oxidoreductase subunit beta [Nitrososphaerota archaeon]MDG6923541.1 2-oxoacid:ferredoxin oxidoreductase subunit beta [Nitrososphaerota archaeon]